MDKILQYYKLVELQNSRKDVGIPFFGTSIAKYKDNIGIAYLVMRDSKINGNSKTGGSDEPKKITVM